MQFNGMVIKNFRNFEYVDVVLKNKNIFFGMNDIGKSNFIHALRLVFDNNIRKNGLLDSDFYKFNTERNIEIIIAIDIADKEDDNNKNIVSRMKESNYSDEDEIYIKLVSVYSIVEQRGLIQMYWGSDKDNLFEIKANGYSFDIDKLFEVRFIDTYLDLETLFKKNINNVIDKVEDSDNDKVNEINNSVSNINQLVSQLGNVRDLQVKLSSTYNRLSKEKLNVVVKSDIGLKGLYSDLVPFLNDSVDTNLYPTAGDGRRKLLAYSFLELVREKERSTKIPIYLIEEPENHLHKSLQIALSKMFFEEMGYEFIFVTTHSPYILYEMNNVNLIRIYKSDNNIQTAGVMYVIGEEYQNKKKVLNRALAEAVFAKTILLIEGPSEQILFEKILNIVDEDYELDGKMLLSVNGVGFQKYIDILESINIKVFVKTDNDFQKYRGHVGSTPTGFKRVNELIGRAMLPIDDITLTDSEEEQKIELYEENIVTIKEIEKNYGVFLSKVGLEYDLNEALEVDEHSQDRNLSQILRKSNPISYLEGKKWENMYKLTESLSVSECKRIYESEYFDCLKRFCE